MKRGADQCQSVISFGGGGDRKDRAYDWGFSPPPPLAAPWQGVKRYLLVDRGL